jgi:hypothetical protein
MARVSPQRHRVACCAAAKQVAAATGVSPACAAHALLLPSARYTLLAHATAATMKASRVAVNTGRCVGMAGAMMKILSKCTVSSCWVAAFAGA